VSDWSVDATSLMLMEREWEEFHVQSAATIFSSSRWLTLLAGHHDRTPLIIGLREQGRLRAAIPLMIKRRGMLRYSGPLPISMYSGLLHDLDTETLHAQLSTLLTAAQKQCHFIALSMPRNDNLSTQFAHAGWRISTRLNLHVHISDTEALWNSYTQSLRRKIRRASECGLQFVEDADPDILLRLHEHSYQRHGLRPPIANSVLSPWVHSLRHAGLIRIFAALGNDGEAAAARAVIREGAILYDWLAGADPSITSSASHWLLHHILLRCSEQGAGLLDFMGANTPGVVDFKRAFGAFEHEYFEAEWYRSNMIRTLAHLQAARIRASRKAS
jgi:CelD/BcsL family acetyltransferase involved in cellulose biosynthesis